MTPELELVLLLAGTRARRRESNRRMQVLVEIVSFPAVEHLLNGHRLLPILGPRLVAEAPVPEAFAERTEMSRVSAQRRGMLYEAALGQVIGALSRAGVEASPLKGPPLSMDAHGDPGIRRSNDIDVLVAPERLYEAVECLRPIGYRLEGDGSWPVLHHVLRHERGLPLLDLHWRVHWYEERFARRLLDSSDGVTDADRVAARFTALLLFYARDGFVGLRLPVDIAAFADRTAHPLQEGVEALIVAHPEIRRPVRAALASLERVVGLRIGHHRASLERREGLAVRLANWSADGDIDQVRATVKLVDALLMPGADLPRFARVRLKAFESATENAVHTSKTLLRWAPALSSVRRGQVARAMPADLEQ